MHDSEDTSKSQNKDDIEQASNANSTQSTNAQTPQAQTQERQNSTCTNREIIGGVAKASGILMSIAAAATDNNTLRYAASAALLASVAIEAPLQEQQQTKINVAAKTSRTAAGALLMASAVKENQAFAYPSMVLQTGATLSEIYEKAPRIIEKVRKYIPNKEQEQQIATEQTGHVSAEIQRRESSSYIEMGRS